MKYLVRTIAFLGLVSALVCCKGGDIKVEGSIDADGMYSARFTAQRDWLLIPSAYKMGRSTMDLLVDGSSIFEAKPTLTVAVSADATDYFIPVDIAPYRGREVSIEISGVQQGSPILDQTRQSDCIGFEREEFYRPQYHFSPVFGWNNDPNGLFYDNGVWHMAYQYNPYSVMWGNMSWGHATSTDLVHWTDHPVIIRPDALGSAFSGSAVIDSGNTAGFGEGAVVALYTSAGAAGQQQSLAYSLDGGYTYSKYQGNPVITSTPQMRTQRDPKVQWIDDKWVMAISFDRYIRFYASQNLRDWEFLSSFTYAGLPDWGTWECPDLMKMEYEGQTKWVATINTDQTGPNGVRTTMYFIGQWTGREFVADPMDYPLLVDWGTDQYAGVTYGNTGGRHVWQSWLTSSPFPGSETPATRHFTGGMALPHDVFLKNIGGKPALASVPAKEILDARKEAEDVMFDDNGCVEKLLENNSGSYQLELVFNPAEGETFGFCLGNAKGENLSFFFDTAAQRVSIDRRSCGLQDPFPDAVKSDAYPTIDAPLTIRDSYKVELFVDRMTAELFVNDGDLVMTNCVFPTEYLNRLRVCGDAKPESARIYLIR